MRKFVCIVVVILLTFVHQSKADITAITCTVGDDANGDKKCQDQDSNAEFPGTASTAANCACKAEYFISSDKTQCLQKITTVDCTTGTAGTTKCKQIDAHSECPANGGKCKCKKEYTGIDSCTKVLGGTCPASGACSGSVDNSECKQQKCECGANFIEESAVCKKALGQACTKKDDCVSNAECDQTCKCSSDFTGTNGVCVATDTCDPNNGGDAKCHGVDPNSECPASICACKADYFLGSDKTCVLKITTVGCTPDDNTEGTTKCQNADENSECPAEGDKCACKAGYSGTDSCTKDAESSATSAWITTSLIATSLLIYLPRLIKW